MFKVLLVASGKGGTGKTSFCAGVGAALAKNSKKVLVIDADSKLRNLDIVLGLSDRIVFSFEDVAKGVVRLDKAAIRHHSISRLFILTAPFNLLDTSITAAQVRMVIEQAKKFGFEYVIIDCPAGITQEFQLFSTLATQGIVITTPDNACIRGAESITREMEKEGLVRIRLVVNRVRPNLIRGGMANNIDNAMDITGIGLLGIVPEDEDVIICGNSGLPIVEEKDTGAGRAYTNIAHRLEGHKIPLMKI